MDSDILFSFVVVEYHSIDDIRMCVQSITSVVSGSFTYEIVISSNSQYNEVDKKDIAGLDFGNEVRWIYNEKNGGFAYAMNCGLKEAKGSIIIFMNPDVRIKYGFFEMTDYLQKHTDVGIIAPQIRNSQGDIQDSFRSFITPINFINRHLQRFINHGNKVKNECKPKIVDWIIGAFVMMHRQTALAIGGFDENYFLYCEDMDLCKRVSEKGTKIVYFPQACIEYEGTRSARHSWKYAFIFLKSLFRYWRKFGLC